jgi:hypothetical protein
MRAFFFEDVKSNKFTGKKMLVWCGFTKQNVCIERKTPGFGSNHDTCFNLFLGRFDKLQIFGG